MNVTETLRAQLKTLDTQQREHVKQAAAVKRNADKLRKAIALLNVPASQAANPAS